MKEKFKLTALERNWILYDIGNSAFTLLVSTLIPIYFDALAAAGGVSESNYLAYWGYAGSISTLLVAIIGPICGTMADQKGFKKAHLPAESAAGCHRLRCPGLCLELAGFSGDFHHCQGGLFLQPGVL